MGKDKRSKKVHWADSIAKRVIAEKGDKPKYTIAAGITPSGTVHIGNFREIITVDLVYRALKEIGKEVRFIYSWDDYDVFRKVPKNMPNQKLLDTFLKKPIVDTPDTFDCKHESYAKHNELRVEKALPIVGISPEFLYQNKKYRACEYAEEMKTAMQKKEVIAKVLNEFRKEPLASDWYPVSIFCEKCGKDTTKIKDYDGNYEITYECECGFKDKFDLRKKGISKLVWRVDWPMRWHYEDVDFEPAGKDHSTVGGSRDTAVMVLDHVWKKEAPIYQGYDFIGIKGGAGKISSSTGEVVDLWDVLEIYEPQMVRWFFASTRPMTEFSISFDLDVIKNYEDFDKCERIYYKEQEVKEDKYEKQKRIYELSSIEEIKPKMPIQVSFRHLTGILQFFDMDTEKTLEYFKTKDENDKQRLLLRIKCAQKWIEKYAPEDFKFQLNTKLPDIKFSKEIKQAFKLILGELEKNPSDNDLHNKFYEICKKLEIETKDFFTASYKFLINKNKGPKLANFINTIGKEKFKKLVDQL
tara:strand:+ start:422 stop:1996 length:1575 start_codon:yes stop_codon:yes gene_type:complete